MNPTQKMFIYHLFNTETIKFGSFPLKSGRSSPYFINIMKSMDTGFNSWYICYIYTQTIREIFGGGKINFIFGPAYKGIPLAAGIAASLSMGILGSPPIFKDPPIRWGYDRKEEKDYGDSTESSLVGDLRDGDRVLIVDDVVTTAATKIEACRKLLGTGKTIKIMGVLVGVDREETNKEDLIELAKGGVKIYSVVKITEVFNHLLQGGKISTGVYEECMTYLNLQRL